MPLVCGVLILTMHCPTAFAVTWGTGVEAGLPANAGPSSGGYVNAVACASAGNCGAVGFYTDSLGHGQGLLVTESSGRWAPGTEAILPGGAAGNPKVNLGSVACTAAGSCSAVGSYTDASGNGQGLLLGETAGTWTGGVSVKLPAGAGSNPAVGLSSVSCSSPGNCSAVGHYTDTSGAQQGLLVNETAGVWGTAVKATLPTAAAANPMVELDSVSCAAAGACTAVGDYTDGSGDQQGLLLTETAGSWTNTAKAGLPAGAGSNPTVSLSSVSCASAGDCSAVGDYRDSSGDYQGLLLTETAGSWGGGVKANLPTGAGSNPGVRVGSVSCPAAGDCTAVGYYSDQSGHVRGLLLTESSSTWAKGIQAILPANVGPNPGATVGSVSCASVGDCSAVGYYQDTSGNFQGLLLTESSGSWSPGLEASLPANAGKSQAVELYSVSCASVGNCSAVDGYTDTSGNSQGLLLDTRHRLTVSKTGGGFGTVTSSDGRIHCVPSCALGYAQGSVVTLSAAPAAGSLFVGWSGAGCSGTAICKVRMVSDQTVTAVFVAPVLSALRVSPTRFVLAGRRVNGHCVKATRKNSDHRRCRRPLKLKVTFQLSFGAGVRLWIDRVRSGRLVGGHCVRTTRKNRTHATCPRLIPVRRAITELGTSGPNRFTIAGGKLAVGRYRLTATPVVNGRERPHFITTTFRIIR